MEVFQFNATPCLAAMLVSTASMSTACSGVAGGTGGTSMPVLESTSGSFGVAPGAVGVVGVTGCSGAAAWPKIAFLMLSNRPMSILLFICGHHTEPCIARLIG